MTVIGEAIAGATLAVSTYFTRKKLKISKEERAARKTQAFVDAETAKAKEMQLIKDDIRWIMKQFSPSPNGGGIMEKLDHHITSSDAQISSILTSVGELSKDMVEAKVVWREHSKWHEKVS